MGFVCAELANDVCVQWVQTSTWVTYAEFRSMLPAIVGVLLLAYTFRLIMRFFR